jgi:hypothetical protein
LKQHNLSHKLRAHRDSLTKKSDFISGLILLYNLFNLGNISAIDMLNFKERGVGDEDSIALNFKGYDFDWAA